MSFAVLHQLVPSGLHALAVASPGSVFVFFHCRAPRRPNARRVGTRTSAAPPPHLLKPPQTDPEGCRCRSRGEGTRRSSDPSSDPVSAPPRPRSLELDEDALAGRAGGSPSCISYSCGSQTAPPPPHAARKKAQRDRKTRQARDGALTQSEHAASLGTSLTSNAPHRSVRTHARRISPRRGASGPEVLCGTGRLSARRARERERGHSDRRGPDLPVGRDRSARVAAHQTRSKPLCGRERGLGA